jgi:DNA-binding GntR family transcriptional regulator
MQVKALECSPPLATGRRRSPSLAEEVAEALEEAIMAGRLLPRERLIEVELAAQHNVSRAPVREALRILERDGLVSKTIQGFEVTDVTTEDAADIFEILAHLEELYTRRAASRIGSAELRRLREILEAMAAAVRRNDVAAYYSLNLDFHSIIRKACPNRALVDLLASLSKKTLRFRRFAMSIPGRLPNSLAEHRRIHAALRRGDADAAGRHARESAEQAYAALALLLKHSTAL